jgi:hypothetical protein
MDTQKNKNVFYLSKDEKANVEYKKYRYIWHSHKSPSTDISMSKKEMKRLLEFLPSFQKQAREIMRKSYEEDVEEGKNEKTEDSENGPEAKKLKEDSFIPNKNWRTEIISKFQQFETRLTLDTYNDEYFIWLRLFFDLNHEKDEELAKKRKANDEDWKSCFGGIIFNDVIVSDLKRFVKKCNLG